MIAYEGESWQAACVNLAMNRGYAPFDRYLWSFEGELMSDDLPSRYVGHRVLLVLRSEPVVFAFQALLDGRTVRCARSIFSFKSTGIVRPSPVRPPMSTSYSGKVCEIYLEETKPA